MQNKRNISDSREEKSVPEFAPMQEHGGKAEPKSGSSEVQGLVRLRKTVLFDSSQKDHAKINNSIISQEFYNSFNYWLLPKDQSIGCLKIGVTSARSGDGKTLVASNLAVSFAVANEKKTVLVDLNLRRPIIHKVFGTQIAPGFLEALRNPEIRVTETPINNLSVLSAGEVSQNSFFAPMVEKTVGIQASDQSDATLGLEHVTNYRDVVYSLEQVFEVIIFDLPTVTDPGLPRVYLKQIDGVIIVVNSGETKKEDIDKALNHFDERQILGFVLNRADQELFE